MKILYLMTEPFGIGGVQSDVLTLTEDLTAKGHIVYVATTDGVLLKELIGKGAIHVDIDFNFSAASQFVRASNSCGGRQARGHRTRRAAIGALSMVAYAALRLMPYGYRSRARLAACPS
jgi:hypothetical protein